MRMQFSDFIRLSHILHVPTTGQFAKCSAPAQLSTHTRIWMMMNTSAAFNKSAMCYHLVELKVVFVLCMCMYMMHDLRAQINNIVQYIRRDGKP